MSELASREFEAWTPETPRVEGARLEALANELAGGWAVVDEHHLVKQYRFDDFRDALAFANRVGELAETLNHHPDIELGWGRVKLTIYTHDAGGLTEGDFVWAARADLRR